MNRDQLNKEDNAAKFNQIWGEKESTYESIFNGQKSPFAESKVRSITENQKMVLQLIKDRPELKDTPLQVLMNGIEFQSGSNGKVYLLVKRDIAVEYRAFHELLVRGTKKVIITNGDYAYTEVVHDPAIIMDIFNELRTSLSGKKPESYELRLMELTGSPQSHEEALGRSGKGLDFLKTIHGDILSVSKTAVNILDLSLPNTQEETPQHRQKIVVFKRVSDGKFQAEGQIAIDVTELRKNADQCKQKIWSWGDESNEALWQVMNQEEQLRNSPQDNLLAKQDFREQLINAYMKALSPKERIRDAYTLLLPDNSEAQHKYEMVQRNIDFIKNRIRELSERDERERGQLYLSTIASKIEEYI